VRIERNTYPAQGDGTEIIKVKLMLIEEHIEPITEIELTPGVEKDTESV
jgi:hypothetical protein